MLKTNWILLVVAAVLFASPFGTQANPTLVKKQAQKAKEQSTQKRKIAEAQRLSVTEAIERLGVKDGAEYILTKGNPDECQAGILRIRGIEDGSISLMLGNRLLAYDVVEGEGVFDSSERDCQITVRTNFKGNKILFQEDYVCRKDSYSLQKTLNFSNTKNKSVLDYSVGLIRGKKQEITKCRVEA